MCIRDSSIVVVVGISLLSGCSHIRTLGISPTAFVDKPQIYDDMSLQSELSSPILEVEQAITKAQVTDVDTIARMISNRTSQLHLLVSTFEDPRAQTSAKAYIDNTHSQAALLS